MRKLFIIALVLVIVLVPSFFIAEKFFPAEIYIAKSLLTDISENSFPYTKNESNKANCDLTLLAENGYSSKELGDMFSADPAAVRMWMTKARRYLLKHPDFSEFSKGSCSK